MSGQKARIRTVEYEPGWGWIARDRSGAEVIQNHRWPSRAIARSVSRAAIAKAEGAK